MSFTRRVALVVLGYLALAIGLPIAYGIVAGTVEALIGLRDPLEGRFGEVMMIVSFCYFAAATAYLLIHWLRWSGRKP
jgi:hypothetical protein